MRSLLVLCLLLFLGTWSAADEKDKEVEPPTIEFQFPQVEGLESFLDTYRDNLRQEVMSEYELAKSEDGIHNPWSLHLEAKMTYQGPFWSMLVSGYDYRGGAHGMPYIDVLYFDPETKQPISQEDLLTPQSYERLSQLCRAGLIENEFAADDEWMLKGTEPDAKNFQLLVPYDEEVQVLFNSYQVAPYAAGVPSVKLPWSEVNPILKEQFQKL